MEPDFEWVILDTETNGLRQPIFVVDVAAQRMRGWKPEGEPFQMLLNHGVAISPEASRVNGYTAQILERDGYPPDVVYEGLRDYIGDTPVTAYKLDFDWDRVLVPEWERLGIDVIGERAFCMLRLTQRLLDPIPAGNFKLQTIRQFYKLPERGAHSALGDVNTVVDLVRDVLAPILSSREITTYEELIELANAEWYPTKLRYGKFKDRDYNDARHDPELRSWLDWMVLNAEESGSRMASWYLAELEKPQRENVAPEAVSQVDVNQPKASRDAVRAGIIIYENLDIRRLNLLITAARERLADLEAIHATESNGVTSVQSKLFLLLKDLYKKRDRLKLVVAYRMRFVRSILTDMDIDPETVYEEFQQESAETEHEYEEAEKEALNQKELTEDEAAELRSLYQKLIRQFHPDRFANKPEERDAAEQLSREINSARDRGDIARLREIADDPNGVLVRLGEVTLDFSDERTVEGLRKLYQALQTKIMETIEAMNTLRESAEFELYKLASKREGYVEEVAASFRPDLEEEISSLNAEAERLEKEIADLTGESKSQI